MKKIILMIIYKRLIYIIKFKCQKMIEINQKEIYLIKKECMINLEKQKILKTYHIYQITIKDIILKEVMILIKDNLITDKVFPIC